MNWLDEARQLFSWSQALRRDFHMHPELGFQEHRTSQKVAQVLRELGLEVHTGIAETGVVAVLSTGKPGPRLLLRADMDALPIQEANEVPYASQNPGVMHACGHDGHMAILLTVARMFAQHREALSGTVLFLFQPAEEGLGGAERMIHEGVLDRFAPEMALALHLWNGKPVGWVGLAPGPVMAAADEVNIHLRGRGGHGAMPHLARDPVTAAGHLIVALQSLVAREVSPLDPAVLSIGRVQGGTAFNIIPEEVFLQGTLRTFNAETRVYLKRRVRELAEQMARAFQCEARVEWVESTPAVVNHPQVTQQVEEAIRQVWPEAVIQTERTMGSEDMAFFLERVPGCYFFVGSGNPDKGLDAPHHHPRFDFDEEVLPYGAALMAAAAHRLLEHPVGHGSASPQKRD